jgi:hypothetical protein
MQCQQQQHPRPTPASSRYYLYYSYQGTEKAGRERRTLVGRVAAGRPPSPSHCMYRYSVCMQPVTSRGDKQTRTEYAVRRAVILQQMLLLLWFSRCVIRNGEQSGFGSLLIFRIGLDRCGLRQRTPFIRSLDAGFRVVAMCHSEGIDAMLRRFLSFS